MEAPKLTLTNQPELKAIYETLTEYQKTAVHSLLGNVLTSMNKNKAQFSAMNKEQRQALAFMVASALQTGFQNGG